MVVIIVSYVKRQVAINSFQRAWTIKTSRPTRANRMLNSLFRQVFNHMTSTATRNLCFLIAARFPQSSDMTQPKQGCLHVHRHLPDVMLHVRVITFALTGDVLERVVIGSFCRSQESCSVVGNKTGLPSFF